MMNMSNLKSRHKLYLQNEEGEIIRVTKSHGLDDILLTAMENAAGKEITASMSVGTYLNCGLSRDPLFKVGGKDRYETDEATFVQAGTYLHASGEEMKVFVTFGMDDGFIAFGTDSVPYMFAEL